MKLVINSTDLSTISTAVYFPKGQDSKFLPSWSYTAEIPVDYDKGESVEMQTDLGNPYELEQIEGIDSEISFTSTWRGLEYGIEVSNTGREIIYLRDPRIVGRDLKCGGRIETNTVEDLYAFIESESLNPPTPIISLENFIESPIELIETWNDDVYYSEGTLVYHNGAIWKKIGNEDNDSEPSEGSNNWEVYIKENYRYDYSGSSFKIERIEKEGGSYFYWLPLDMGSFVFPSYLYYKTEENEYYIYSSFENNRLVFDIYDYLYAKFKNQNKYYGIDDDRYYAYLNSLIFTRIYLDWTDTDDQSGNYKSNEIKYHGSQENLVNIPSSTVLDNFAEYDFSFLVSKYPFNRDLKIQRLDERSYKVISGGETNWREDDECACYNSESLSALENVLFPTDSKSENEDNSFVEFRDSFFGSTQIGDKTLYLLNVPGETRKVELYDSVVIEDSLEDYDYRVLYNGGEEKKPSLSIYFGPEFEWEQTDAGNYIENTKPEENVEEVSQKVYVKSLDEIDSECSKVVWIIITENNIGETVNISYGIVVRDKVMPFRNKNEYTLRNDEYYSTKDSMGIIKEKGKILLDDRSNTILSTEKIDTHPILTKKLRKFGLSYYQADQTYQPGDKVRYKGKTWKTADLIPAYSQDIDFSEFVDYGEEYTDLSQITPDNTVFYYDEAIYQHRQVLDQVELDIEGETETAHVKSGPAEILGIKGNTVAWNQLLKQGKLVDMGLPSGLLWATCNIDITQDDGFAASPFQYECSFFSWGNIDGHNPISNNAFDYNWGGVNAQAPWYEGQVYGSTPGSTLTSDIVAGDTYDAARYNLGSLFKMPTSVQFQELIDNCDFVQADGTTVIDDSVTDKIVTVNGIVGIYLKSKVNGNLMFFSASGIGRDTSWLNHGSHGNYWSASFHMARYARSLYFNSGGVNPQDYSSRSGGYAIRAVVNPNTIDIGHNNHKYYVTEDINHDLTRIFGAGNEPTTVADFEAWLAQNGLPSVADYNAGELLSVKMNGMQTEDSSQQTLDTLPFDVTTITGINTSTNVREVIFPQGMKQADYAGTVKDVLDLRSSTATRNVGYVKFTGNEDWTNGSATNVYVLAISDKTIGKTEVFSYPYNYVSNGQASLPDKCLGMGASTKSVFIRDDNYTTLAQFTSYLATQYSNGTPVTLVYPLATPITYTDLQDANGNPINSQYIIEHGGTETILPQNTSSPVTVSPVLVTKYETDYELQYKYNVNGEYFAYIDGVWYSEDDLSDLYAPSEDSEYWEEVYPIYSPFCIYNLGERVLYNSQVWESLCKDNIGNQPDYSKQWIPVSSADNFHTTRISILANPSNSGSIIPGGNNVVIGRNVRSIAFNIRPYLGWALDTENPCSSEYGNPLSEGFYDIYDDNVVVVRSGAWEELERSKKLIFNFIGCNLLMKILVMFSDSLRPEAYTGRMEKYGETIYISGSYNSDNYSILPADSEGNISSSIVPALRDNTLKMKIQDLYGDSLEKCRLSKVGYTRKNEYGETVTGFLDIEDGIAQDNVNFSEVTYTFYIEKVALRINCVIGLEEFELEDNMIEYSFGDTGYFRFYPREEMENQNIRVYMYPSVEDANIEDTHLAYDSIVMPSNVGEETESKNTMEQTENGYYSTCIARKLNHHYSFGDQVYYELEFTDIQKEIIIDIEYETQQ